ncbi:hypothetical protein CDG62_14265 [Acinetobacter sp. WCHA55]|uniref:hypothetical protein n=1 Tax=Acinetobacter sp. WCHA55 TaxID=2004646 RepID=UPI000B3D0558|nr:hypothetical protein [Acinetobacter sp. WCHA55]AYA69390.1 hypothetical protein CDG62_14265 [Acinetobacter sp. WCHA55]
MLIDFKYTQLAQFESVIERLRRSPKQYLDFASVADFYQATWLGDLPSSASWAVTGLDDGAEHFEIRLACFERVVFIHIVDDIVIQNGTH